MKQDEKNKQEAKERHKQYRTSLSQADKRKIKAQEIDDLMKRQMAIAIWKHRAMVQKAMPFFSTLPMGKVDDYEAYYETELQEKPEEDLTNKIFR